MNFMNIGTMLLEFADYFLDGFGKEEETRLDGNCRLGTNLRER